MARRLAVALHGVDPATFERCALIRDWLDDHGVDGVTLLVARDPRPHPLDRRSRDLDAWLSERRAAGDTVTHPSAPVRRAGAWRRCARAARRGDVLAIDVHPAHLRAGRRVAALERILRRAAAAGPPR